MRSLNILSLAVALSGLASAQYTIYQPKNQVIFGGSALNTSNTSTAAASSFTNAAAYDATVLAPPPVPNPPIPTQWTISLPSSGGMANLSIKQQGAFFGFSVEMSVANQVLGKNSSLIQVPFLNLMANIIERAGWVQVRVGGNSQESAELVPSLPGGVMLAKDNNNTSGPTSTPPLAFTPDLLYLMANISTLINAHWFLGIPFFNTTPFSLEIVEQGQAILGDSLIGFQAGNEPDLYANHQHRPTNYSQFDYFGEVGILVQQLASDNLVANKNNILIIPSISTIWTPEDVWNTGIVASYDNSILALAVERYPDDNCAAVFPSLGEAIQNPQDIFINYLQHNYSTNTVQAYLNSTQFAQQSGKPFIMFETNSASCSGFAGISNSFGAALWGLDWAFTMAFSNFTTALFHVGGQNAFYNPFTPPPTNQSTFRQWTVGPIYYSALAMAEAMGPSNASQVVDITQNINTPGYAIYENGSPTKVALLNYVTDPSGASDYTAVISIGGGQTGTGNGTPSSVQVKYLLADSVSSKGNFTWAGQTLGNNFESDGRLQGDLNVTTVQCNQGDNTCSIIVPAPGFALVFLTSQGVDEVSPTSTQTFPTTATTRAGNTIFIDPSMLATSNGNIGMDNLEGATSPGHINGASSLREVLPGTLVLVAALVGVFAVALR